MTTRIQRHLKVVAFNANGIGRQHYELSEQLLKLQIVVALLLETHLKPHESFFILNYQLYQNDCFLAIKGRTAQTEMVFLTSMYNLHSHVSAEATEICILIRNSQVLLAAAYKSAGCTWGNANNTELLSFSNKSLLVDAMNAKNAVGIVKFQTLQVRNYWII
jgi:hypothetical protein